MSTLTAAIMLAFVLGDFIVIPNRTFTVSLADFSVRIPLTSQTVIALLTSGLAVTGTTWLLATHPARSGSRIPQHWVLPALSAWVLSITLSAIPEGALWWAVLIFGTAFLSLVWFAEFISVNPQDANFRLAASGLTALAFALYLALTINLRAIQIRLIFLLPAASIPVFFITARYLVLKLQAHDLLDPVNRSTSLIAAGAIAAGAGQIATTLHFLPLSSLSFGLALLSPIYAANILLGNLVEDRPYPRTVAEPALVLIFFWGAALWAG